MTDTIRVSNSKVKTWRRCPNKFRYKYVEKLEPRIKGVALERGSWIHELLQYHYDGEDWKALHKKRTMEFYQLFEEQREELGDLPTECLRVMNSYLRHWKEEDSHYTVVDSELNEYVDLGNGITLQIVVDLIVEDKRSGLLWAWDHKTRKNFESTENMLLDPQLTLYFRGLELLGYKPLGGVTYNEIRTKPPTVPKLLVSGGLSKAKSIDTDVRTYMAEIRRLGLDPADYSDILRHLARNQHERFFRRQNLPKDPPMIRTMMRELKQSAAEIQRAQRNNAFPRTFIPQSCKWDCEYKALCIAELHGADISSLVKMNFRKRGQVD
jgi:hypothetical protein